MNKWEIRNILRIVYATLFQNGYHEISLNKEYVIEYIFQLEQYLLENNLLSETLFTSSSFDESYEEYKKMITKEFVDNKLGSYNDKNNSIEMTLFDDYYIYQLQKRMYQDQNLIYKLCYIISKDERFNANESLKTRKVGLR